MKYILVTGGVVSGMGKSLTSSSIGLILKSCGLRITHIKIDPCLNLDASTISPSQHGEVYVLDDGGEVDLDLGNYERFLDINLTRDHNVTTGKIYQQVIEKERMGDYLGKTVQIIPHVTNAIQEWIERVAKIPVDGKDGLPDICVIELGGTIGEIESRMYIEALSQLSCSVGTGNFCLVHFSLVPVINVVGEQKTKPTQNSIRELQTLGLKPDILACRSTDILEANVKSKLSRFCYIPEENIVSIHDVPNIWHIPLLLRDQKAHEAILKVLNLHSYWRESTLEEWKSRAEICDKLNEPVRIAIVGNFTCHSDAHHSVVKALMHASVARCKNLVINWVAAQNLEDSTRIENPENYNTAWNMLKSADGILVPGGFGDRGVEGKIIAAKHARKNRVPYLGICQGMQIAVIEYARSVVGVRDANSTEFDTQTTSPYVIFMPEVGVFGLSIEFSSHETMRLGSRRTYLHDSCCKSAMLYGNASFVDERHRNGYEVNPEVVKQLEDAGMAFVGKDETGQRMEIVELPSHPYFIGTQFHPEFKSRPGKPSPLFEGFISAASGNLDSYVPTSHTMTRKLVKQRSIKMVDSPPRKTARILYTKYIIKY